MGVRINEMASEIMDTLGAKIRMEDWDRLRDYCDRCSGGNLDCFQLDALTDTVQRMAREHWATPDHTSRVAMGRAVVREIPTA